MSPPKYKLIYFNLRGRGELIRLILHSVNQEFEDERLEMDAWPKLKSSIPGGKIPLLEITGDKKTRQLFEGWAIARMIAREHGMMGGTDNEYYDVERVLGQCEDIYNEMYKIFRATEADKPKLIEEFKTGNASRLLAIISKHLEDSKSGFVAGDRVTLADLAILCIIDQAAAISPDSTKGKHPIYEKHREAVSKGHGKLGEYLKSTPATCF